MLAGIYYIYKVVSRDAERMETMSRQYQIFLVQSWIKDRNCMETVGISSSSELAEEVKSAYRKVGKEVTIACSTALISGKGGSL
jgi:hypothetical protein